MIANIKNWFARLKHKLFADKVRSCYILANAITMNYCLCKDFEDIKDERYYISHSKNASSLGLPGSTWKLKLYVFLRSADDLGVLDETIDRLVKNGFSFDESFTLDGKYRCARKSITKWWLLEFMRRRSQDIEMYKENVV